MGLSVFVCSGLLIRFCKRVKNPEIRFITTLALSAVLHPLSFFYSFTMAIPMLAISLDRVYLSGRTSKLEKLAGVVSVFFLSIYQCGILRDWGYPVAEFGGRSIGVLIFMELLLRKTNADA